MFIKRFVIKTDREGQTGPKNGSNKNDGEGEKEEKEEEDKIFEMLAGSSSLSSLSLLVS